MKDIRSLSKGLVAVGMALALVSPLVAQTTQQGIATVVSINGDVRFGPSDNLMQPLTKVGTVLKPGTIIQTAKDGKSYVDIVLGAADEGVVTPVVLGAPAGASGPGAGGGGGSQPAPAQSVIRLWYDTAMGLDKLDSQELASGVAKTDTELDLRFGRLTGNIKKLTPGSSFHIKLPNNAIAGIRGTTIDISTRGQGYIHVGTGMLIFSHFVNGNLVTEDIAGGFGLENLGARGVIALPPQVIADLKIILDSLRHFPRPPFNPPGPPPYVPPVSPHRPGI